MPLHNRTKMRLYNDYNERLYLNISEVARFIAEANRAPERQRSFALMLAYTGMRLSETRYMRGGHLQLEERKVSVRTLKKRDEHHIREIPVPSVFLGQDNFQGFDENEPLWHTRGNPISRTRAYDWIKDLMQRAGITGPKACPKGLRHAFGARAVVRGVPLPMVQKWMGHASLETTAIYTTVLGPEQLILSDRMWYDAPVGEQALNFAPGSTLPAYTGQFQE